MWNAKTEFRVGEVSKLTDVKTGTIRFYEKCGFLSPVKRLPNGYRIFGEKHIYQIRICRLVFGGFVNKRLRKISMGLIAAAREWDLGKYRIAAADYLRVVEEDIAQTKKALEVVRKKMARVDAGQRKVGKYGSESGNGRKEEYSLEPKNGRKEGDGLEAENGQEEYSLESADGRKKERYGLESGDGQKESGYGYTKKQAAALVGVTPEAIRNWERNGLLGEALAYQKRYYPPEMMDRMYVIRLLLDNGYSMMAIKSFFVAFDAAGAEAAVGTLTNPGESETLIYQADRYLETLLRTKEKAEKLCALSDEMRALSL